MPNKIKNIEVGKFYFIHDSSETGHPGFVVSKDDINNRYIIVKTDSDKPGEVPKSQKGTRHITKLNHPISKDVVNSYVKNRPILCKRKDIGKLLPDLKFNKDDYKIVENVSKQNPELSRSLKKKR